MASIRFPQVFLTQPIEGVLRAGHPWVFADALRYDSSYTTGDVVDVMTAKGEFVGRGLLETGSPIRVRLWTYHPDVKVDAQLLERRIRAAAKRRIFPTPLTNGFRLLNGEGDRTPGLTCDLYDKIAVLRIDGLAAERWIKDAVRILRKLYTLDGVVVRRSEKYRESHRKAEWYEEPRVEGPYTFLEEGLRYYVDPIEGQKTGFFLDQRANRRLIAEYAVGRRLLNLFSYSGGFSLAAAARGAARTTSVDLSGPALTDARRNFELNGIPSPAHDFVVSDVMEYLGQFSESSAPFEVAVCDPPSFARRREDLEQATHGYITLFSTLMRVMPNGSRAAFASCSSHVSRDLFLEILSRAACSAGVRLVSHGLWGADVDHPTLIGFPEGDYLQFTLVSLVKE